MTQSPIAARLVDAAFELFTEHGYDKTTVEEITARADCGRATFFRHFRSKEDVVFPDHEDLLMAVRSRLESSNQRTALAAVSDAVRLVLLNYVSEGERARLRYELIRSEPSLRDREIASVAPYQRLFREFISAWMGDAEEAPLRAELMSAAVVAAHNHVLRRWLRGESAEPAEEVEQALGVAMDLFAGASVDPDGPAFVVAFSSERQLSELIPEIERVVRRRR